MNMYTSAALARSECGRCPKQGVGCKDGCEAATCLLHLMLVWELVPAHARRWVVPCRCPGPSRAGGRGLDVSAELNTKTGNTAAGSGRCMRTKELACGWGCCWGCTAGSGACMRDPVPLHLAPHGMPSKQHCPCSGFAGFKHAAEQNWVMIMVQSQPCHGSRTRCRCSSQSRGHRIHQIWGVNR